MYCVVIPIRFHYGAWYGVGELIYVLGPVESVVNEQERLRRERERAEREAAEQERLRRERERAEREAAEIKKVDITITSDAIKEIDEEIKSFECPITNTTMKDPIITPHEKSFEKSAIEDRLNKHNICPVTDKSLNKKDLIRNIPIKNAITE